MANEARIATIETELRDIEVRIAQKEGEKGQAVTVSEIARIEDELVSLRARRTTLQFELVDLQAAGDEVAPIG